MAVSSFSVIHKVATTPARTNKPQAEVIPKKKKKPINYVETLYISMAFVGGLGVIIAIGMCICHPLMRFVELRFIDFRSKESFSEA